jgi:4-hydroxysphinganine ceramide fatty acyl 2-hydroxylase
MPPVMFAALQFPFTRLAYVLFPTAVANGIISGSFAFCEYFEITFCLCYNALYIQMSCMIACTTREIFFCFENCIRFFLMAHCDRLHHTQLPSYLRSMKKYHLAHHYKNFELGFGVTSDVFHSFWLCNDISDKDGCIGKIWDIVFKTVLLV